MKKYIKFLPHLFFLIFSIFSVQFASIRCAQGVHALFFEALIQQEYLQGLSMGINPLTIGIAFVLNNFGISIANFCLFISLSYVAFYYLIYILLAYIIKNKAVAYTFLFSLFFLGELFFYAGSPILSLIGYACLAYSLLVRKSLWMVFTGGILSLCTVFYAVLLIQGMNLSYVNPILPISTIYFTSYLSYFFSYYSMYFFYLALLAFVVVYVIYHKHKRGFLYLSLAFIYFLCLFFLKGYYVHYAELSLVFWVLIVAIVCGLVSSKVGTSTLFFWLVFFLMICGFSDIYNRSERYEKKEIYYGKLAQNLRLKYPDSTLRINAENSNINVSVLLQSPYIKEEFKAYSYIYTYPIYNIKFPSTLNLGQNYSSNSEKWAITADSVLIPYQLVFYLSSGNEEVESEKGFQDYIICYKDSARTQPYEHSENIRLIFANAQNKQEAYEGKYGAIATTGVPQCMHFTWEDVQSDDLLEVSIYRKGSEHGYLGIEGESLSKKRNGFYISTNQGTPSLKEDWQRLQIVYRVEKEIDRVRIYGYNSSDDIVFFDLLEVKVYRQ